MDDLLKSIYTPSKDIKPPTSLDDVWRDIVAAGTTAIAAEEMTLEDFLTKTGAVREEDVRGLLPPPPPPPPSHFHLPPPPPSASDASSSLVTPNGVSAASVAKGKRRAIEEPVDKATLQKQRRMIKNRESAARSRERKQAYTTELEAIVQQLEEENARLMEEEAERNRQRLKQLVLQFMISLGIALEL
ncbi:bZIP transcription factor 12-like isoform X2 [Lotus japonicus]|uniref:bZIP transcription factor 12-like isoform X2 n=1 Tax=Lotus japonicus TaxID=34305 RepID=UPI00258B8941|nr:bZIP transcription factor 12-like isoform X2 [Lotus japonicus]